MTHFVLCCRMYEKAFYGEQSDWAPISSALGFFLLNCHEGIYGTAVFIFNGGKKKTLSPCHLIKSYLTFKLLQM